MNYFGISKSSFVNGDGIRTVLWVSGCNHKCPGCHNPDSWDPAYGREFDAGALVELFRAIDRDVTDGLTISGGDPMFPDNRSEVERICRMFRTKFGERKSIWMYTGYLFHEIQNEPVVSYLDVIVDGPFVSKLKYPDHVHAWAGSSNQKLWRRDPVSGEWKMNDALQS